MKKYWIISITTLIIALFVFSVPIQPAKAQEEKLTNPGVGPDDYLYGIDRAMESIHKSVTENKTQRAKIALQIAEERLSEGLQMSYIGKNQLAQRMSEDYNTEINESLDYATTPGLGERNRERIQERVANATTTHLEVLEQLKNKVPGPARSAIENAMNHSMMGRTRALGHLAETAPATAARMHYNHAQDIAKEIRKEANDIKIKAEIEGEKTEVEVKNNGTQTSFTLNTTDINEVITQVRSKTNLSMDEIKSYIEFEKETDQELEVEVKVTAEETIVLLETNDTTQKYSVNLTDRDAIVQFLSQKTGLVPGKIYRNMDFEDERQIEIEIIVTNNTSKINATVMGENYTFTLNTTNPGEIIREIANKTNLTTVTVKKFTDDIYEIERKANRYQHEINLSTELMERARQMGINVTQLQQRIANNTTQNLNALRHAYQNVPEPAKDAILHAMNMSLHGQHRALEAIRQGNPNLAEQIEKGMPPWAQEMRNKWVNNSSFPPGKQNNLPGQEGNTTPKMPGNGNKSGVQDNNESPRGNNQSPAEQNMLPQQNTKTQNQILQEISEITPEKTNLDQNQINRGNGNEKQLGKT